MGSVPVAYAVGRLTMGQRFVVASLSGVLTVLFDVARSPTCHPSWAGDTSRKATASSPSPSRSLS
jgi:hypothetical protein